MFSVFNHNSCHIIIVFIYFKGEKVLQRDEFTRDLFRFLQLLCEGHNNGKWTKLILRKMCDESVLKHSWIELILMCLFFPLIHLVSEGNWHVNNLNCRVQFEFLSFNVISVFMPISFYANRKPVASHVGSNSSVVFTLWSTLVQFSPHKHLYPTGYLKIMCLLCLHKNMRVTL